MRSLLLLASPNPFGVGAMLAGLLAKEFENIGETLETLVLSSYNIAPCCNCGMCQKKPNTCKLDTECDQAKSILCKLQNAKVLIILSPIYFYALPAHCKALIDRSQRFWYTNQNSLQEKLSPTIVLLYAGRKKGDSLFSGSLLTLKYFLLQLSRKIVLSRTFYGLEKKEDIFDNKNILEELHTMVHSIQSYS